MGRHLSQSFLVQGELDVGNTSFLCRSENTLALAAGSTNEIFLVINELKPGINVVGTVRDQPRELRISIPSSFGIRLNLGLGNNVGIDFRFSTPLYGPVVRAIVLDGNGRFKS
jgi:hypothetical protein